MFAGNATHLCSCEREPTLELAAAPIHRPDRSAPPESDLPHATRPSHLRIRYAVAVRTSPRRRRSRRHKYRWLPRYASDGSAGGRQRRNHYAASPLSPSDSARQRSSAAAKNCRRVFAAVRPSRPKVDVARWSHLSDMSSSVCVRRISFHRTTSGSVVSSGVQSCAVDPSSSR